MWKLCLNKKIITYFIISYGYYFLFVIIVFFKEGAVIVVVTLYEKNDFSRKTICNV